MLLVTVLGFAISDSFNILDTFITRKILKKAKPPDSHSFACVMLVLVTVIWTILSGFVAKWMYGWGFIDGIYACFVTSTTIGYGDFAFSDNGPLHNEMTTWYGTIGLTLFASIVDMIVKMVEAKGVKCDSKKETKLEVIETLIN